MTKHCKHCSVPGTARSSYMQSVNRHWCTDFSTGVSAIRMHAFQSAVLPCCFAWSRTLLGYLGHSSTRLIARHPRHPRPIVFDAFLACRKTPHRHRQSDLHDGNLSQEQHALSTLRVRVPLDWLIMKHEERDMLDDLHFILLPPRVFEEACMGDRTEPYLEASAARSASRGNTRPFRRQSSSGDAS